MSRRPPARSSETEALVKLLVQLHAVLVRHPVDGPLSEDVDDVPVVLNGLTLRQARAAYPGLHRLVLGYRPQPLPRRKDAP